MNEKAKEISNKMLIRISRELPQVVMFVNYAKRGVEKIIPEIASEHEAFVKKNTPVYELEKESIKNIYGSHDQYQNSLTETIITNTIERVLTVIESSAIVLAHSVLDGLLLDALIITQYLKREYWEIQIKKRKVDISEVYEKNKDQLVNELIIKKIEELDRESILNKAEHILAECKPGADLKLVNNYEFSMEKLKSIDDKRHEIVHSIDKLCRIEDTLEILDYIDKTCVYFWALLNHTFGVLYDEAIFIQLLKE